MHVTVKRSLDVYGYRANLLTASKNLPFCLSQIFCIYKLIPHKIWANSQVNNNHGLCVLIHLLILAGWFPTGTMEPSVSFSLSEFRVKRQNISFLLCIQPIIHFIYKSLYILVQSQSALTLFFSFIAVPLPPRSLLRFIREWTQSSSSHACETATVRFCQTTQTSRMQSPLATAEPANSARRRPVEGAATVYWSCRRRRRRGGEGCGGNQWKTNTRSMRGNRWEVNGRRGRKQLSEGAK